MIQSGNKSNNDLFFIDEVAIQRFEFLERIIEKDPSNVHLVETYKKLIECMFELETRYILSEQTIIEKEIELDNRNEESSLERLVRNDG